MMLTGRELLHTDGLLVVATVGPGYQMMSSGRLASLPSLNPNSLARFVALPRPAMARFDDIRPDPFKLADSLWPAPENPRELA
jgi:hypothetical protein